MNYLTRTLGIQTIYNSSEKSLPLPSYIYSRYEIRTVSIDGIKAVFVYPKGELEPVSTIEKHMNRIGIASGAVPVLILERLTSRQKEYLIRYRIPFVVDGKQIYLPFLATYLQEKCDGEKPDAQNLLPSSQLLLLYFIYRGCGELMTADAARALGLTPMSISRASRQLENTGLVRAEKRGVEKALISDKTPRQLFEEAKRLLSNPVKRVIYIPKNELDEKLLLGGYSALSEYSMLNPPAIDYYADCNVSKWEKAASNNLQDINDQCAIELWRYDPGKLADGKTVDRLSLALALQNDNDERTGEAVETMLEEVWRDIDGKRN